MTTETELKEGADGTMQYFTGDQIVRQNTENSQTKTVNRETANPKKQSAPPHQKSGANTPKLPWQWKKHLHGTRRNNRGRVGSNRLLEKQTLDQNNRRRKPKGQHSTVVDCNGMHRRPKLTGRLSISFSMLEKQTQ